MNLSALRSGATAAARRLRSRPLSTNPVADGQESLRKATADLESEINRMKARLVFHGKLNRVLMMITTPVMVYLGFELYSLNREIDRLVSRLEALNDEAQMVAEDWSQQGFSVKMGVDRFDPMVR